MYVFADVLDRDIAQLVAVLISDAVDEHVVPWQTSWRRPIASAWHARRIASRPCYISSASPLSCGALEGGPFARHPAGNMGRPRNTRLWSRKPGPAMIIASLLDTDLYKFTMMQVVLHHFPDAQVEYRFKCRNPGVDLSPYVAEIATRSRPLQAAVHARELDYLRRWRFFKSDFVDLLGCSSSTSDSSASSRSPRRAKSTSPSGGRGCTRSCSRCRCSRSCPKSTIATCIRSRTSSRDAARLAARSRR